jgi:ABC-type polysaccharide/polyol phosphate transport system ATPase subunit
MTLVHLEEVRVDFPIYGAQRSLRQAIVNRATGGVIQREGKHQGRVVVRALTDISLRLEDGDRLGLIGHNGSGKSTLLKVLAGVYQPIAGRITLEGRVTPLLDMMPGLDPDETGYENLITAGMLLGLSREEVERKTPEIEEFSELGEYLTLPVRTYSAGMMLRLGFSLVTALEPGILLMDEGFSTGDLRFAERAAERMNDFLGRSRIIVLASHSDEAIKSMCNKAALMQEGRILAFGPVDEVIEQYREMVHANAAEGIRLHAGAMQDELAPIAVYNEETIRDIGLADRLARTNGAVRITRAVARDKKGATRWTYQPGETVNFYFEYEIIRPVASLGLGLRLCLDSACEHVVVDVREVISSGALHASQNGVVELTLPRLTLLSNRFHLYVWLGRADFGNICEGANSRPNYDVLDSNNVGLPCLIIESEVDHSSDNDLRGVVRIEHEFKKIKPEDSATIDPNKICAP